MGATDGNLPRGVFLGGVVLSSCALAIGLWWWKRTAFCFAGAGVMIQLSANSRAHAVFELLALLVLVFVGVVIAESVQEFIQSKRVRRSQRVQVQTGAIRVSRALYNQLDTDTLWLLASSRDFGDDGASILAVIGSCCTDRDMPRIASDVTYYSLISFADYERLLQLDSVRHGGATETEIQRLPVVPFTCVLRVDSSDSVAEFERSCVWSPVSRCCRRQTARAA